MFTTTLGGTPAPATLSSVAVTVPAAAMLNEKNFDPPTGSVLVNVSSTVDVDGGVVVDGVVDVL
jgi:hypothetical protein